VAVIAIEISVLSSAFGASIQVWRGAEDRKRDSSGAYVSDPERPAAATVSLLTRTSAGVL
jgi:hypothetical protein